MAAHRAQGVRVVLLFLTRGEMTEALGPLSAEQVAAERTQHAEQVGRMLGCEVCFLDFSDTSVEVSAEATRRVARAIAEIKPDAVLTWGDAWVRGMRHPDHQATGQIVRGAVTLARIKRVVEPTTRHRAEAPVSRCATGTPRCPARPLMCRPGSIPSWKWADSIALAWAGRKRPGCGNVCSTPVRAGV